jgi:hypothetical protein
MTAYVDDMGLQATVQNGDQQVTGKWCHLFADTHEELMAVAEKAGLNPKWIQDAGTPDEHFDVTGKKILAVVKAGAQPVSWRFTGQYFAERHDRARGAERAQERCDDIGCAEQPGDDPDAPVPEARQRHSWGERTTRDGRKVCFRKGCGMEAEQRCNPATRRPLVIYQRNGVRIVSDRVPPCGSELPGGDLSAEERGHLAAAADRNAAEAYRAGDLDRAFRLVTDARCLDPGRSRTWDERERQLAARARQRHPDPEPDEPASRPADPAVIEAETQQWLDWNAGLPRGLCGPEWRNCPEHGTAAARARTQEAREKEGAA